MDNPPETPTENVVPKRKWRKRLIIALLLLTIILVVIYIFSKLNQPVTATVTIGKVSSSPNVYNIDLTPTPIAGHYVAFNYPKGMHITNTKPISVPSVEDFTFYVKDVYSWTLAIDVSKTPTGDLSQSSSYTLRKNNPQTYSESFMTVHGQQIPVMTDSSVTGGFSKVAYLTHDTLVGTISLIGNDAAGTKPLATTFAMVLNSWQWL